MGESSAILNHAVNKQNGKPSKLEYRKGVRDIGPHVYPVPLDPGDSTALDLRVVNNEIRVRTPTVGPIPWAPSTHALEGVDTPTLPTMHAPVVYQDSLMGLALDWFMSLKTAVIPMWADVSWRFIDQYQYCAETAPTLLELSTREMAEGQKFEDYATKRRAQAAKHVLPISELSRIEGPTGRMEMESSRRATTGASSIGGRKGKETSVNAINLRRQGSQQYSMNFTPTPPAAQSYDPPLAQYQQQYYSAPSPLLPLPTPQQEMIEKREHLFNAVKPPNVQNNPLPDHDSSSNLTVNMIDLCTGGKDETQEGEPTSP
ncbi:hypothetical protein CRG98_006182 [Punica granatum]|uniref:Retrotransposon gag domain-containing protein n=1 Tax=Punica granatum TaxID=22663 RepID=A0A2I0KY66_PUNGR|nr:hypothetical protein CRG98_006182 [Punica granatum]